MVFKRTDLEIELQRLKEKTLHSDAIVKEFYKVLETASQEENRIKANTEKSFDKHQNNFQFDLLETDKIFHVEQIKTICIDYRLRFLDSKYFKGVIPTEAFHKIKKLEALHDTEIKNFKIVAPSKLFKLEDKDDPLLFAPLGNNYYYLIHKWGNDLSPFRKIKMWPYKSMINLILMVFVATFLITYVFASSMFASTNSNAEIFMIGFFVFKTIGAIVLYFGIAKGKNFNPFIWNSKYYN